MLVMKMLCRVLLLMLVSAALLVVPLVNAQEEGVDVLEDTAEETIVVAMIESEGVVAVGKNMLFDASSSLEDQTATNVQFNWDFGDGATDSGIEVTHSYETAGDYTVTLQIELPEAVQETSSTVFVYDQGQALLVDETIDIDVVANLQTSLRESNVHLETFSLSDELSEKSQGFIRNSTFVFSMLEPTSPVIVRYNELLSDQTLIILTDTNLNTLKRLGETSFDTIGAKKIILAHTDALLTNTVEKSSIARAHNEAELIGMLATNDYAFLSIDRQESTGITNFFLAMTNFLRKQGVPDATLFLLLSIPIIATIIAFFRQFIGIATLGIYTPDAFYYHLPNHWRSNRNRCLHCHCSRQCGATHNPQESSYDVCSQAFIDSYPDDFYYPRTLCPGCLIWLYGTGRT